MRKMIAVASLALLSMGHNIHAFGASTKVIVTGTLGGIVEGNQAQLATDVNGWLGKNFTINWVIDTKNSTYSHEEEDDIPGEFFNSWVGSHIQYDVRIGDVAAFSGIETVFNWIETSNDLTVPAGIADLPPNIQVGKTYDIFSVDSSGIGLACISGGSDGFCGGAPEDVSEGLTVGFGYFWDTAQHDAISDDSLPFLIGDTLDFSKGFGNAYFDVWQHSQLQGGQDIASIMGTVNSITITTVPLPQTWALLLSGIGLLGMAARRKALS